MKKEQHGTHKNLEVNLCARKGYAIPALYKTPAVLLIHIVKSGKNVVGNTGKKTMR